MKAPELMTFSIRLRGKRQIDRLGVALQVLRMRADARGDAVLRRDVERVARACRSLLKVAAK